MVYFDTRENQKSFVLSHCSETNDKNEMCEWISKQFNDPFDVVMEYLNTCSINWDLSVKASDKDGKTIGYLTISDYHIEDETETIKEANPSLLEKLNSLNYISGFSFIVAKEWRGTMVHKQMLQFVLDDVKKYDFIFIPVRHELKTHNYWKRFGAIEFYEDEESKFYAIPFNDKFMKAIEK